MKKQINIFIVSPNDVKPERDIVRQLCHEIDEALGNDVEVDSILWDYGPQDAHKDAQANVNERIKPSESDMVIIIIWERLGSNLDDTYIGDITGQVPIPGTQWEIENALSNKNIPTYFYFKTVKRQYEKHEFKEAEHQTKILSQFLEDINFKKDNPKNGYQEFKTLNEFEDKIKGLLKIKVKEWSGRRVQFSKIDTEIKNNSIKKLYLSVFTVGLLFFVIFSMFGQDKEKIIPIKKEMKISEVKKNIKHINENNTDIHIEMTNNIDERMTQKTYDYFMKILTNNGIELSMNDIGKGFKVVLTQDIKQKTHIVSDLEMVKTECTLSYVVMDLNKNSTIKANSAEGENMGFDSDMGKTKCLNGLYKDMSTALIKTITRI